MPGKQRPRTYEEYRLLLRVLGIVLLVCWLLRWVRLKRFIGWLGSTHLARPPRPVSMQTVAWYTDALLQRMPSRRRGNCLPRSLTLFFFAVRAGLPVRFHCGVRRVGESLDGHAWLTLGDQLFLEQGTSNDRYTVIFSYPDTGPEGANPETLAYQGGSG